MTDRVGSLFVVLAEDARLEDLQGLIDAIGQFKGVIRVEPRVTNCEEILATARAKHDLHIKLVATLTDLLK